MLKRTIYRMDELKRFVDAGNWNLDLPITCRGVRIDVAMRDSQRRRGLKVDGIVGPATPLSLEASSGEIAAIAATSELFPSAGNPARPQRAR